MRFIIPGSKQYEDMLGLLAKCHDFDAAASCMSSCRGCASCISSCRGCSVVITDCDVWEIL